MIRSATRAGGTGLGTATVLGEPPNAMAGADGQRMKEGEERGRNGGGRSR